MKTLKTIGHASFLVFLGILFTVIFSPGEPSEDKNAVCFGAITAIIGSACLIFYYVKIAIRKRIQL